MRGIVSSVCNRTIISHQEDKLMTLLLHIVMYKQDTIFAYNT